MDIGVALAAGALLLGLAYLFVRRAAARAVEPDKRFAALLAHASDSFAVVNADGTVRYASPAAGRLMSTPQDRHIGQSIFSMADLVHPDDRAISDRMNPVFDTPGTEVHEEFRVADGTGGYRWLSVVGRNRLNDPLIEGIVFNFHDVTDRMEADALLARLGTAVEQSSESIMITNASAEIEYVNGAFERATGYTSAEVLGRNPRFLQSGMQSHAFYEAMWATLSAGRPWVADFINRRKDGTLMEETGVTTPLVDEAGVITGYLSVRRDVTAERRLEVQAQRMARERALVAETIRHIDARASPETTAQAICRQVASLTDIATAGMFMFQLDGAAAPYGFVIGGEPKPPLRRVPLERSIYLRERARRGPWIEAWEERPTHPYNAIFMRLGVRAIAYAPIRDRGEAIGFLHISSAAPEAEELLSASLPALVEFAEIAGTLIGQAVADRIETASDRARIREIIAQRAFSIVYQPIVDLQTIEVVGYEALARFNDRVAPDVRFAEADGVGLGTPLEMAALSEAIASAQLLPAGAWLNVNASPALILDPRRLERLLRRADRPIVIEVTEHAQIADYEAFRAARESLPANVRIAIDDAGAGFASLRHVLELQPSFVKLDRSLIESVDTDRARAALVSGMAHFAASTGATLIAEGIESAAELGALRRLGVTLGQGYLLGRPQPAANVGLRVTSLALPGRAGSRR
jgi:PAS domain S-box-containing protein